MAQNITTSQVINEHCSCCHGNYYHSNVANGIWGRAREICENYCQIQLGSFRLNSAGRPPGPSLISYQIERRMGMLELRHPDVRVITGFWRSLIEEGWPYPATLISIIADIFLLVVVQPTICTQNIIVLTMPVFQCISLHCLEQKLYKGRVKKRQVQVESHSIIDQIWHNSVKNKLFLLLEFGVYFVFLFRPQIIGLSEHLLEYNEAWLKEMWCWEWCQLNENHIGLMGRWFGEREQVKNSVDV